MSSAAKQTDEQHTAQTAAKQTSASQTDEQQTDKAQTGAVQTGGFEYVNSIPLDLKYYSSDKYNKLRRCKLLLFTHCLGDNVDFQHMNTLHKDVKKKEGVITPILIDWGVSKGVVRHINTYLYPKYNTKEYIAERLERGCFNRSVEKAKTYNVRCVWDNEKFVNLYHSICYKVASNIDTTSSIKSDYIRNKILNNDVYIPSIANMTSKQLCPKKYEVIDAKMNKRTNLERKIKYSELYRCRKCKRNQCTTERRYARSLDEGVDLTINCMFCHHSWNA